MQASASSVPPSLDLSFESSSGCPNASRRPYIYGSCLSTCTLRLELSLHVDTYFLD